MIYFWRDYVGIIGSTLIYVYIYTSKYLPPANEIWGKVCHSFCPGGEFVWRGGACMAGCCMVGGVCVGEGLHGGGCMAGETATKRAVRILLESILVLHNLCTMCRFNKKWKKRGKLFTRKQAYRLLCLTIATRCHHWGTLYSEVFKWTSVTGIRSWLPEVTSGGEGPCTVRSHVWRGNLNSEVASWVMVTWWPSPPRHTDTHDWRPVNITVV